jgi:hypothetical protein
MDINMLFWFIGFACQTVILFGLAMVLIKLQHLDQHDGFHFLKVLGVCALACALDKIPYFGHYLAVPALLLGIKTVTGSPYTDVLFTVAISYALMFLVNLFGIMVLMGDLRPSAREAGIPGQMETSPREQSVEAEPETVVKTNASVPAMAPKPAPSHPTKAVSAGVGPLTIKGLSRNGAKSVVTIDTGVKSYTLFLGDTLDVQTADGTSRVRFESLDADSVTLNIDGKPLKLPVH